MKIAILGSGLMGRVLGFRLYQEGYVNLTLIDADTAHGKQSPAYIAAGMLAPLCESVMGGKLIYTLGKNSLTLWQQYLSLLNLTDLYNNNGTLLLATREFSQEISHYLKKISFNTNVTNYYQLLDNQGITKLEPELNFHQGYFLPTEAAINARSIFTHLGNYLAHKVNWHNETLVKYTKYEPRVNINGISYDFDLVIDCRGLGSRELQPQLRGIRGEIIRVHAPEINISRPIRLFHPRHNIYISPYMNNHYIIGATEIEAEDFSPISIKSTLDLLNCANIIHGGFSEARIIEMSTNCRPTLSNNLPQLIAKDNFLSINGLYRHGFLLSPALAETVINYLKHQTKQYPEIWSN